MRRDLAVAETADDPAYDIRFRASYHDLLTANRYPGVFLSYQCLIYSFAYDKTAIDYSVSSC